MQDNIWIKFSFLEIINKKVEFLPHFPKSVHASDSIYPEFSTSLLTIDTAQIEMAHLGATKYLIEEVARLEKLLANKFGTNQ